MDVFTSSSFGWPRFQFSFVHWSRAPCGAVAGRRLLPCPSFVALHGLRSLRSRLRIRAFSFFAVHFRARRRREIYLARLESPKNLCKRKIVIHRPRAIRAATKSCSVNWAVDKLTAIFCKRDSRELLVEISSAASAKTGERRMRGPAGFAEFQRGLGDMSAIS